MSQRRAAIADLDACLCLRGHFCNRLLALFLSRTLRRANCCHTPPQAPQLRRLSILHRLQLCSHGLRAHLRIVKLPWPFKVIDVLGL